MMLQQKKISSIIPLIRSEDLLYDSMPKTALLEGTAATAKLILIETTSPDVVDFPHRKKTMNLTQHPLEDCAAAATPSTDEKNFYFFRFVYHSFQPNLAATET
jgi:hypothetical protein